MMLTPQFLWALILHVVPIVVDRVFNVTLMIYGMWKPPFLQCLAYTAPGFELATASVNEKYADVLNFQLQFVSSRSVVNCADLSANYYQIAETYYDLKRTVENTHNMAVFYPGCDSSTTISDFGREWNILTVNTGTTFSNLRNRTTYPTTIALGPHQYEIYGVMIGQLTTAYNWTSIAIVYDVSGAIPFNLLVAQEIRRYMRKYYEHVDVHAFPVDIRENIDFQLTIKEISIFTRVILLSMPVNFTQIFLVAFLDSGESKEEYVQIYIDFSELIGSPLSQSYSTNTTNVLTKLWQSVFIISICFTHDDVEIIRLRRTMKERTMSVYNATFRNGGQSSEFAVTAYTSLLLYAEVLNETVHGNHDPHDGTLVAGLMLNRTFCIPTVGSLYIDKDGERQNTICLYNFKPELQRFERVQYFDSAVRTLYDVPNTVINWGTPGNLPQLNEPKCGFRKNKAPCIRIGNSTVGGIASGVVLVVLLVFCTALAFLRMQNQTVDDNWWLVDLQYLSRAVEPGGSKISGENPTYSYRSNVLINAPMSYRGTPVWAKVVQISRRTAVLHLPQGGANVRAELRVLLAEIRSLAFRCPNINPLVGIGLGPGRLTYITAFCRRGSLCDLIEEISLDWGLKCSLIADLVEGVSAIHRTVIRRHGHLRPSKCLIDGRMVLKITEVGAYDVFSELHVELVNPKNCETIGKYFCNAWVAPELRIGLVESATFGSIALRAGPPADVYAVGGLINYLLQDHKHEKDERLVDFTLSRKHSIPTNAGPLLSKLLYECRSVNPWERPNICQVKGAISRIVGSPGKLLDGLVRRLEEYAVQLENAVALRTQTLKQEMERCDLLLGEMLPRYVLVQLRIGHQVQGQMFHLATLLMTHVAGFDEFVIKSQSSPLEIVMFLNAMFTMFDRILGRYDCYKVETITDSCLVVSGLPVENDGEHVYTIANLAVEMRKDFEKGFAREGLRIQAGLHSGPCAAGVVGTARPRYCIFGDSVNVTSRLACSSKPGKIQISYATKALLSVDSDYKVHQRGMIYLKGVGSIMTFWLEG